MTVLCTHNFLYTNMRAEPFYVHENDNEKNDGSAGGNILYLQSPNYKNIRDSNSWKLCLNLCSLRWLQPKHKRVSNFNPVGSNTLYTLLWIGRMMDNSLLLNIARESDSKWKEKKEYLKQFALEWSFGMWLFLVVMVCWVFGMKLSK